MSSSVPFTAAVLLVLLALPTRAEEVDPVERALAAPQATGLLVMGVVENTQASEAGFVPGDVIVAYGGTPVAAIDALREAMQAATAETIDVEVVRIDGSKKTFTLQPGPMGVQLSAVEKGKGAEPLPPATKIAFDFSSLGKAPHDDWYDFSVGDGHAGFEHGTVRLEDGKLVMRHEVAFDGGERWGVNHFDVTVVLTAEPVPKLVSFTFQNPVTGYVGEGALVTGEDGKAVLKFTHTGNAGGPTTVGHEVPSDLPAIPSYAVETLASCMPREKGACFHYRPVTEGSGEVGRPAALRVVGEEEVEIGGAKTKAFKIQVHGFGGDSSTAFWVNDAGRVVKAEYGGAVATAAPKEDCLKDLHHGLQPRTAD